MKLHIQRILLLAFGLLAYAPCMQTYSIVFVHIGKKLPVYLTDALTQARLFNEAPEIYLIANQQALDDCPQTQTLRIAAVPVETLQKTKTHTDFIKASRLDRQGRDGFWFYASERFLYLDDFMQQYALQHVVHLESDNMLYVDIAELMPTFLKKYPGIGAVFDNDERCIPGFVYIANKQVMHQLAEYFAKYAHSGKNDMEILAIFKNSQAKNVVINLPIIMDSYKEKHPLKSPAGHVASDPQVYSKHLKHFKSIFDGAALGQYLGGIDPRNGPSVPGFINESCIFNPSDLTYRWELDAQGRKVPFALYADEVYRINNLHIHSKNLKKFLSTEQHG
jgi:hypothetical protein